MSNKIIAGGLLLGLLLAGCGSSGGNSAPGAEPVASLASVAAPATTSAPGTPTEDPAGRPQMRLDDSPQRRDRLIAAWDACLIEHGAKTRANTRAAGVAGAPARTVVEPVPVSASKPCQDKLPLLPPELEPGLNPHYRDDWKAEVACLREHGVKVHLTSDTSDGPDGLSWTYDDDAGKLPADADRIQHDCELAAFGRK
jgi:hypothetical protein